MRNSTYLFKDCNVKIVYMFFLNGNTGYDILIIDLILVVYFVTFFLYHNVYLQTSPKHGVSDFDSLSVRAVKVHCTGDKS